MITWSTDKIKALQSMSADEIELFESDIQDAIDGVLEDWGI